METKRNLRILLFSWLIFSFLCVGFGAINLYADGVSDNVQLIEGVLEFVNKHYIDEIELRDIVYPAVKEMIGRLDPHSAFFTPEEIRKWKEQEKTMREYTGIRNVEWKTIETDGKKFGYLKIGSFMPGSTANEVKNAIDEFESQKVCGAIIDLRNNPGGRLDFCIDVLSSFLPPDTFVISLRGRVDQKDYRTNDDYTEYFIAPLVVLINNGSASASEIMAGIMRDHKRAILVGKKTRGKGSAQTSKNLPDGSQIRLTTYKYFLPDGECIQGKGISPHIEAETEVDEQIMSQALKILGNWEKYKRELLEIPGLAAEVKIDYDFDYLFNWTAQALKITVNPEEPRPTMKILSAEDFQTTVEILLRENFTEEEWSTSALREEVAEWEGFCYHPRRLILVPKSVDTPETSLLQKEVHELTHYFQNVYPNKRRQKINPIILYQMNDLEALAMEERFCHEHNLPYHAGNGNEE